MPLEAWWTILPLASTQDVLSPHQKGCSERDGKKKQGILCEELLIFITYGHNFKMKHLLSLLIIVKHKCAHDITIALIIVITNRGFNRTWWPDDSRCCSNKWSTCSNINGWKWWCIQSARNWWGSEIDFLVVHNHTVYNYVMYMMYMIMIVSIRIISSLLPFGVGEVVHMVRLK